MVPLEIVTAPTVWLVPPRSSSPPETLERSGSGAQQPARAHLQRAGGNRGRAAVGVGAAKHQCAGPQFAHPRAAADDLAGREDVGRALDVKTAVEGGPVHRVAVDSGQGESGYLQRRRR